MAMFPDTMNNLRGRFRLGSLLLSGTMLRGSTLIVAGHGGAAVQLQGRDAPGAAWVNIGSPDVSFTLDANHSGRDLQVVLGSGAAAVASPVLGPIGITDRQGVKNDGYYGPSGSRVVLNINTVGSGVAAGLGLVAGTGFDCSMTFYRGQQPEGLIRVVKRIAPGFGAKVINYMAKIIGHHEDTVNPSNPNPPLPAGRVGAMESTMSFAHISGPKAYQALEEMFLWSQAVHTGPQYRDLYCFGEIGVFYYLPTVSYNYFVNNGIYCGTWTDNKGRTFQMWVAPGPHDTPWRIPYMVAFPVVGANVANWDQGGQDKRGLINFWMERGRIDPSHYVTGHSFGIEGLSDATQNVADILDFSWDIPTASWSISTGGIRTIPDTADSFYVMQKTSRGTAMAYRFIRKSGDAAGSGSIGGTWDRFRPILIAEFDSFTADPKGAANTRLRTWMEDIGATDMAFARSAGGPFMGSFHGGETATSAPVITIDGVPVDITQPNVGDAFELAQNTNITDGTATMTVANSKHVIVSGAAEMRFDPGTLNGSTTSFFRAYVGMGIASGAGWTEVSFLRQGGGQKRLAFPNTIGTTKGIGTTYVYQARDISLRNPTTGANWRICTNAPSIAGYRDSSVIREAPSGDSSAPSRAQRAKAYFDFGGSAFGTKSGISIVYRFEIGDTGATAFAASQVTDGTFDGGQPTASGGAGPWFKSDNTGGSISVTAGVARFTRANDGAGDERLWQGIATAVGSVWLFGAEEVAEPAGSPKPALALGLNANGSVSTPAPLADKTYNTGGGFLGHVFAATQAATQLHLRLPAGTSVAQQVADIDNAVAIQIATAA